MSEWQVQKLSDVIEIIGGGTPKRSEERYWNGDIDWLSVADFNNNFRFVTNSSEKITELGLKNSSTKLLQKGQLIISARGTVGCLAQLAKPMAFNQSCYGLNGIKDIIDNDFLYYFLKHNIGILKSKTHGSVFDTITRDTFEHIEINFPNLDKQKEIAEILGDFDKKIQLNTQINQTLEAIAQAIFKSWFVDFDPVRAKAQALSEGKSEREANLSAMAVISGKAIEDLSQTEYQELWEIADAFPSELVENSEFGEVPKGWEIVPLSTFGEIICGKTPTKSKAEYYGNDIPFIKIPDMHGKVFITQTIDNLSLIGADSQTKKYIPKGSICVSCIATVGLVSLASRKSQTNQQINSIIPNDLNFSEYLYLYLSQLEMNKYMKNLASGGSATLNMNTSTFSSIEILKPNNEILHLFHKKSLDIFEKILKNEESNQILAQTRDLLLPKLLSGEIKL